MTLPTLSRPILDYFPLCLGQFSLFSFGQTCSYFPYSEKAILHAILVCILIVTGFKAFKFCPYAVNDYHNWIVGISINFAPQSVERIFFPSWQNGIFIGRKEMGMANWEVYRQNGKQQNGTNSFNRLSQDLTNVAV